MIGAGMGRTGTSSLAAAFERLGYVRCHHMRELLRRPRQARTWKAAYRGEAVDWQALLADYRATTDWPSSSFYRELMAEYPEAKVVLTIRDPGRWYESVCETIYPLSYEVPRWLERILVPLHAVNSVSRHNVWEGVFGGRFLEREHALEVFEAHIEEVKREVPPERLLVFSVKQGWEPLCEFLDVPVPDEPFPYLNEREVIQGALKRLKLLGVVIPIVLGLLVAVLVILRLRALTGL